MFIRTRKYHTLTTEKEAHLLNHRGNTLIFFRRQKEAAFSVHPALLHGQVHLQTGAALPDGTMPVVLRELTDLKMEVVPVAPHGQTDLQKEAVLVVPHGRVR